VDDKGGCNTEQCSEVYGTRQEADVLYFLPRQSRSTPMPKVGVLVHSCSCLPARPQGVVMRGLQHTSPIVQAATLEVLAACLSAVHPILAAAAAEADLVSQVEDTQNFLAL
jgi:hypothetical protein